MTRISALQIAGLCGVLGLFAGCLPDSIRAQGSPSTAVRYEAYAIRFGVIPAFAVSNLVAGAETGRTLDIPVMVWLLKGNNGRNVLVDSGFYRQKFVERWKVRDFRSPADAVAAAGVAPEQITDVVISHAHWDHVDGADLFPKATIWMQRDEYQYYTGEAWHARNTHGGVDEEDVQMLVKINLAGRLRFVNGDDQEPIPGIRCYTGGRHTFASQYVTAESDAGTIVLTSDNVYLYENLEKRAAIAQTLDATSNLKAQDRIRTLATKPALIVPGHDPAVFERFQQIAPGIVRIQ
jgi:glyoxylase-like metal-dependent hydrolase (beta-lactamase superfamily II)